MSCFDGLIGIKGKCGTQEIPESGLYLNDLPHIGMVEFDSAISSEHLSAYDELVRKQTIAETLMVSEVRTHLASMFNFSSIVENVRVGFLKENKPSQSAQTNIVGVNIKFDESPYLSLSLTRVGFFGEYTGDVTLYIFDLLTGQTLETFTVSAVAGEVVYTDVLKRIKTRGQKTNILIGYDATGIDTYKTNVDKGGDCFGCMASGGWATRTMSFVRGAKIGIGDDKIMSNTSPQEGTSGLLLTYSIECDIELYLCSIRHLLAPALWYKTGIVILREMVASKRFNSLVQLYKKDYKEAILEYESEYSRHMSHVLNNMVVPKDLCFSCNPRAKTMIRLP